MLLVLLPIKIYPQPATGWGFLFVIQKNIHTFAKMITDFELIKLLNVSDKASFEALYNKYVGMVYNFLNSVLRNEVLAEDLTQWCFMQLWESRSSMDPNRNLPAWLYVTARNAAYKEVRRKITASRYVEQLCQNEELAEADSTLNSDLEVVRKEVLKVIDKLPDARRRIFMMRVFENKSVAQIAEELGLSPKTVETQIYRAKSTLKKQVSELLFLAFFMSLGF